MFVDTAAWVAVADSSDKAGSAVREARDEWLSAGGMLTTTDFSFTDCCSFAVMRELRIRRALTLDSHFRQMRFAVVP